MGTGVYIQVIANVVMLPGESFVSAVSKTFKKDFGATKICFDVSITVIAILLSFVLNGKLQGVREGTIIAAVTVGFFARILKRKLVKFEKFILPNNFQVSIVEQNKNLEHNVIVIDREFGSGGREIGVKLAESLGYTLYDNDIIKMTAEKMGYSTNYIKDKEENIENNVIFDFKNQSYGYGVDTLSIKDRIFKNESEVIEELASKGNCVIIGRCADYVLKNSAKCLTIFLHADKDIRVKRTMEKEKISEKEAENKISKKDATRASYYEYYTNQKWGDSKNYTFTLDTGIFDKNSYKVIHNLVDEYYNSKK